MVFTLKDFSDWSSLRPLTLTRSVADIRIGILTIREKWILALEGPVAVCTEEYLQAIYGNVASINQQIIIRSSLLPNVSLVQEIKKLPNGASLWKDDTLLAMHGEGNPAQWNEKSFQKINFSGEVLRIEFPWDIFRLNGVALEADFAVLTKNKKNHFDASRNFCHAIGTNSVFMEEGAKCENVFLNASEGPIYIGKNAEIMEGSMVRGPFALGHDSQLKMGTKIYGATTIGPHCKVGGEVTNSVIFGYTNKAHDGFLGNSVLGEWCNLGADTNNSNLKNNYGTIKVWSYDKHDYQSTGLQFCGLIMGDHSKSGINTMFNTGTVVGVSANVFGGGFPKKYIPSFAWGGSDGFESFDWEKALEVITRVMDRRKLKPSDEMKKVLRYLYEHPTSIK